MKEYQNSFRAEVTAHILNIFPNAEVFYGPGRSFVKGTAPRNSDVILQIAGITKQELKFNRLDLQCIIAEAVALEIHEFQAVYNSTVYRTYSKSFSPRLGEGVTTLAHMHINSKDTNYASYFARNFYLNIDIEEEIPIGEGGTGDDAQSVAIPSKS